MTQPNEPEPKSKSRLKTFKRKPKSKESWWMEYENIIDEYPISEINEGVREDFQSLIFAKPNRGYRYALKRDMTEQFKRDLERACGIQKSRHLEIIGPQDFGKSTTAFILSKEIQKHCPESQIIFVYSYATALQYIFAGVPAHSAFTVDEPLFLSGPGSATLKRAFANVYQMCRKYMLHFIFNVEDFMKVPNVSIYLELFGYNKETGECRCLWRDKRGRYKGLVYLQKNFDDNEYKRIAEVNKDKKWAALTQSMGIDTIQLENADETVAQISKAIKKHPIYKSAKSEKEIVAFMRASKEFKYIPPILAENSIAPLVKVTLRTERKKKEKEKKQMIPKATSIGKYNLSFTETGETYEQIKETAYKRLHNRLAAVLTADEHGIYKALIDGESYQYISERFFPDKKTDKAGIFRVKDKVQQEILGYVGEEVWEEIWLEQGHKIIRVGGYTSESDFIDHTVREVQSFKTFTLTNDSKGQHGIAEAEIQDALRLGYALVLIIWYMRQGFKKFIVSFQTQDGLPARFSGPETPPLSETSSLSLPAVPSSLPPPASQEKGGVSEWANIDRLLLLKKRYDAGEDLSTSELDEFYGYLYKAGQTTFLRNGPEHPDTINITHLCVIVKWELERRQQQESDTSSPTTAIAAPGTAESKKPKKRSKGKKRRKRTK